MTDNMKCPFCGTKFDIMKGISENVLGCPKCKHIATIGVWQALIDGKKAQEDLKYTEEELECAKHNYSVLSEQKEIAYQNYLKITSDLQTQLQKTQEALKVAIDALSKIDTFDCHGKGAIEIMTGMVSIANEALYKITSITKTGNEI